MKYVILGGSAAGVNGARELRRLDPEGDITLISKDTFLYSRCILHHYLAGTRDAEQLSFAERDFAERYRVRHLGGRACVGIDTDRKTLRLDDGSGVAYDKLLIATGAGSFFPPIPGLQGTGGVVGFRNFDDAAFLKREAATKSNIVIMGGGLVGIDALAGLLEMGKTPAVVEVADRLLPQQLDRRTAGTYQKKFEERGAVFHLNADITEVRSDEAGDVKELVLADGRALPCDLLVVTVGVQANVAFLKDSPIALNASGLIIDSAGRTNLPDVFGAGDVTGTSPIWPAAVKQGMVAARGMAGGESRLQDFFASKSTMNFEGIPSMSLGLNEAPDEGYAVALLDEGACYKKIIHKDGKIYGAVLQGDLSYGGILTQLIANKIDVGKVKKPIFDIDYSDFFNTKENFEFYYEGDAQ